MIREGLLTSDWKRMESSRYSNQKCVRLPVRSVWRVNAFTKRKMSKARYTCIQVDQPTGEYFYQSGAVAIKLFSYVPRTGPDSFHFGMEALKFWEAREAKHGRPCKVSTKKVGRPRKRRPVKKLPQDGNLESSIISRIKRNPSKYKLTRRGKRYVW